MKINKYIEEMKNFLLKYNLDDKGEEILKVFNWYINRVIKTAFKDETTLSVSKENERIDILVNDFKNKLNIYLSYDNKVQEKYLDYIKNSKNNFLSTYEDEEEIYKMIKNGKFDFLKQCLVYSDYFTIISILHSVANQLGFDNLGISRYKDSVKQEKTNDGYAKIKQAIKDVE